MKLYKFYSTGNKPRVIRNTRPPSLATDTFPITSTPIRFNKRLWCRFRFCVCRIELRRAVRGETDPKQNGDYLALFSICRLLIKSARSHIYMTAICLQHDGTHNAENREGSQAYAAPNLREPVWGGRTAFNYVA